MKDTRLSRQEDIVLNHLNEIETLSSREAEDLYRIRDLPKRISVLRQEGHEIVRRIKTDRLGQRYARYALLRNEGALYG
tara:strand:- start:16496 stop:16732 length:237 start_codon:yes stop_codon:yes gene_type:complete